MDDGQCLGSSDLIRGRRGGKRERGLVEAAAGKKKLLVTPMLFCRMVNPWRLLCCSARSSWSNLPSMCANMYTMLQLFVHQSFHSPSSSRFHWGLHVVGVDEVKVPRRWKTSRVAATAPAARPSCSAACSPAPEGLWAARSRWTQPVRSSPAGCSAAGTWGQKGPVGP